MVGALGACFGRVVTMDSPKALPPGSFQWEATLWHEMAHVYTMQMSNQRVPRWLSEGISAFEEKRARPEWARPNDVEYVTLLNRGETIKLPELNAAFTDPRTISLAYYQAALLVEHLVELYGDDGVAKLVRSYAQGIDTDEALKSALDTDFDKLQATFDQFNDRVFAKLRPALKATAKDEELQSMPLIALRAFASENPQSFVGQMALGRALLKEEQLDEAVQAFERAAALVPVARGAASPHAQLAAIAMEKKDRTRAIAELQEADGGRLRQHRSGPSARHAAPRGRRQRPGNAPARCTSASRPSIPTTPARTACLAGWRCSATNPRPPRASSARSSRSGRWTVPRP